MLSFTEDWDAAMSGSGMHEFALAIDSFEKTQNRYKKFHTVFNDVWMQNKEPNLTVDEVNACRSLKNAHEELAHTAKIFADAVKTSDSIYDEWYEALKNKQVNTAILDQAW